MPLNILHPSILLIELFAIVNPLITSKYPYKYCERMMGRMMGMQKDEGKDEG